MRTFSEIITFANKPTGSGQIYTEELLQSAFDIYMSKDKSYRYGCIDAPSSAVIQPERISHYLLDTWWEHDALWGEIEISNSPMGAVLSTLLDNGADSMTLGLAAMATFKPSTEDVCSRDLFEVYEEAQSSVVDNLAVITVYVLPKSNTNH